MGLGKDSSSLNQKYELKAKLKKILEDVVEREVVLQAEGVLAPPERDKAKNLAKTQNKLDRVIQNSEEAYQLSKRKFCDQCKQSVSELKNYCSFCVETPECEKK